jgi:hypothetical protein
VTRLPGAGEIRRKLSSMRCVTHNTLRVH